MPADTSAFVNSIKAVIPPLGQLKEGATDIYNWFLKLSKGIQDFIAKLIKALDITTTPLQKFGLSLKDAAKRLDKLASVRSVDHTKLGSGIANKAASMIGGFGKTLGGLTSVMTMAVESSTAFVQALSPGTVDMFTRALADVQATLGQGFIGVFEVFTDAFRQIGGILNSVMKELAPVMKQLAEIIVAIAVPTIKIFAESLHALMPFFKMVADMIMKVVDALQPLFAVLSGWAALGSIVANLMMKLVPIFEFLANTLKKVTEQLLLFAVSIAKSLGADKFIEAVKRALSPNTATGEHAAAPAQISGIEQMQNELLKLAFAATGSSGTTPQTDNEKLLAAIEAVNPNETIKEVVKWLEKIWDKLPNAPNVSSFVERNIGTRQELREQWSRGIDRISDWF